LFEFTFVLSKLPCLYIEIIIDSFVGLFEPHA
jgi:hypothetical protein